MTNEDVVLGQLSIEVEEIAGRFRQCFEAAFGIGYEESEAALAGMAHKMVHQALGQPFDTEDEDVRQALLGARKLERLASKSIMKRHLLYSLSIGRACLDKVADLAEAGDIKAAISALSAAAMASGSVQVAATEIAAKAANGKATSVKRKDSFSRLSAEAIERWRSDISPNLSASLAAEKLRSMGIPISHGKLSRLISAEKRSQLVKSEEERGVSKLKRVL